MKSLRLLAAAIALCSAFSASGAASRVPPHFFGMNYPGLEWLHITNPTALTNHLNTMSNLGIDMIRFPASWAENEPTAPSKPVVPALGGPTNHTFTWTSSDNRIKPAVQKGFSICALLLGMPCWAANAQADCKPQISPPPPKDDRDFAAYAEAYARHYGPINR